MEPGGDAAPDARAAWVCERLGAVFAGSNRDRFIKLFHEPDNLCVRGRRVGCAGRGWARRSAARGPTHPRPPRRPTPPARSARLAEFLDNAEARVLSYCGDAAAVASGGSGGGGGGGGGGTASLAVSAGLPKKPLRGAWQRGH